MAVCSQGCSRLALSEVQRKTEMLRIVPRTFVVLRSEYCAAGSIESRPMAEDLDCTQKIAAATDVCDRLYATMLEDLDSQSLGFGWWTGQLDAKRVGLISEYLVASVGGVAGSLKDCEFLLDEYRKATFADESWIKQRIREVQQMPGHLPDDFKRAIFTRDDFSSTRSRRIRLAREHTFYHLAQAADRLAAVIIGVGALSTPIIKADWTVVVDDEKWARALGGKSAIRSQSALGRNAQEALRGRTLEAVVAAGPQDWLSWSNAMRNTSSHRAPKLHAMFQRAGKRGEPTGFVELFYRQPSWDMTEALLGGPGESHLEVWLNDEPALLLAGCIASMAQTVEATMTECAALWERRRGTPSLLVQPGGQWPRVLGEAQSSFSGYGHHVAVNTAGAAFHISPDVGHRMRASGLLNSTFWSK